MCPLASPLLHLHSVLPPVHRHWGHVAIKEAMAAHADLTLMLIPAFIVETDHQEPLPERPNGHQDGQLPSDARSGGRWC